MLIQRHDALRTGLRRAHPHDPKEKLSWWTAYEPVYEQRNNPQLPVHRPPLEARTPIDAEQPPLFHLGLGDDRTVQLTANHLVFDGTSLALFWRELGSLYRGQSLPPIASTYHDFLQQERSSWQRGDWDEALGYWRETLTALPPALAIPHSGDKLSIWPLHRSLQMSLTKTESRFLQLHQRSLRTTPFAYAIGLFGAALGKVFDWPSVRFMTPLANRTTAESWQVIGLFANIGLLVFPVRQELATVVQGAQESLLSALSYGHFPLSLLRCELPAVDQMLLAGPSIAVRQPHPPQLSEAESPGLNPFTPADSNVGPAQDFGLGPDLLADFFMQDEHGPTIKLTYRSDRLHDRTMRRIMEAIRALLSQQ